MVVIASLILSKAGVLASKHRVVAFRKTTTQIIFFSLVGHFRSLASSGSRSRGLHVHEGVLTDSRPSHLISHSFQNTSQERIIPAFWFFSTTPPRNKLSEL